MAPVCQRLRKAADLGRLADPLPAFESDEYAAIASFTHVACLPACAGSDKRQRIQPNQQFLDRVHGTAVQRAGFDRFGRIEGGFLRQRFTDPDLERPDLRSGFHGGQQGPS